MMTSPRRPAFPLFSLVAAGLGLLAVTFSGCKEREDDDGAAAVAACGSTADPICPSPVPAYAAVATIIDAKCASCHTGPPRPWPLSDYVDLVHWKGPLLKSLQACTMPPVDGGVALSADERATLLGWVACGLPK